MLILKRKKGQWLDITHSSGDVLRIRIHEIEDGHPGYTELCFDDDERNFAIERPERKRQQEDKARLEQLQLVRTAEWKTALDGDNRRVPTISLNDGTRSYR
jgi:hypothetical protein